jgi:RecA/RadA recombinase
MQSYTHGGNQTDLATYTYEGGSCTAWEMLEEPIIRLTSGCALIDSFFEGGLGTGVHEFVGEASAGKSQLALQFCGVCVCV